MKPHAVLGYSMIEVLVAMLVLSAGVIGAAGLQLAAWRLTQQSVYHSSAQQLAAELAEWVHVFDAATLSDLSSGRSIAAGATSNPASHCYGKHCSAGELVVFVMEEWQKRLGSQLQDAEWRLCRDGASWNEKSQTYRWSCEEKESAPLVIKVGWRDRQVPDHPLLPRIVLSTGR